VKSAAKYKFSVFRHQSVGSFTTSLGDRLTGWVVNDFFSSRTEWGLKYGSSRRKGINMRVRPPGKPQRVVLRLAVLIAFLSCSGFAPARAAVVLTANFDGMTEGIAGTAFTDGGITFSSLDQRVPGQPVPNLFAIEATTFPLTGFTPRNYLTFGTNSPGNGFGFGRFGSANIDFSGMATSVTMDIFGFGSTSANTLTLEGIFGGNVVASDTVNFLGDPISIVYLPLSISGMFDSLRLVAAGPFDSGVVLFGMDNVNVTLVPEPAAATLLLIGCGAMVVAGHRSRVTRRKRMG